MVYIIMGVIVVFLAWRWVVGIDYMKDFEIDYKGEDFLG